MILSTFWLVSLIIEQTKISCSSLDDTEALSGLLEAIFKTKMFNEKLKEMERACRKSSLVSI